MSRFEKGIRDCRDCYWYTYDTEFDEADCMVTGKLEEITDETYASECEFFYIPFLGKTKLVLPKED